MKKFSFTKEQVWQKIQRYCAYQERSQHEVRQKLFDLGLHTEDVGLLMVELISSGFLNEERFARSFCSGKFRIKKWGRNKIKSHLKNHRIPDNLIKTGLTEIDPDEYFNTLKEIAEKKWQTLKGGIWQKRAKTYAFLHQRGFENDLIQEALKEIGGE